MAQLKHLGTANDDLQIAPGGKLYGIIVGTALATAVVTVYSGTTTSGTVLMTIDAASKGDALFGNEGIDAGTRGIYIKLTTANAKVSVIFD